MKYKDLKKATNNFQKELGRGAFGRVYEGTLNDGRMVAVNVLMDHKRKVLQKFFNEVMVVAHPYHPNLVSLYGCTDPRDQKLLLVYELVPNGTVADHLHGQHSALTWTRRIQIAVQTADVLAYLHGLEPPIIHRDVKTCNILLTNDLQVKVADFGMCRFLPWDFASVLTRTQRTMGYRDPNYESDSRFSEKTDVYSFGVVLMELISGLKAVDVDRQDIYLADMVLRKTTDKKLEDIVDPKLRYRSNINVRRMIDKVFELASKCLEPMVHVRPSMSQILRLLKDIQHEMQHIEENEFDSNSSDLQLELDDGGIDKGQASQMKIGLATIMEYEDLRKATNNFQTEIGYDGYGTLYQGKLKDGQMVAVKVLMDTDRNIFELFLNEVFVLSHLRHKNMASLFGCTSPRGQELLLVYELELNGNLADHLHGKLTYITWTNRVQIALETADAIAYLHAQKPPIIHRDVNTSNILLAQDLQVKVAGFLFCSHLPWDAINVSTKSEGAAGYGDPDHERFFNFSEKTDVYSFGVVLLELISGQQAVDLSRDPEDVYLTEMVSRKIIDNTLEEIFDLKLGHRSNDNIKRMIEALVELACECLQSEAALRPSMAQVLTILSEIKRKQHIALNEFVGNSSDTQPELGYLGLHKDYPGLNESHPNSSDSQLELGEGGYCKYYLGQASRMKIALTSLMEYEDLREATNNFQTKVGEGGYGTVYQGKLKDGQMMAVKVLLDLDWNVLEQFFNEVFVLSRLRHENLVSVFGCTSPRGRELLLAFEFALNGTIADHLYGKLSDLTWTSRIQITVEAADAIAYLHAQKPPIIHRDVNTRNILLTHDLQAKVADFGMCRHLPWDAIDVITDPVGTVGYRDPEYERDSRLSNKSDVYSFGVVLLELISGQQALDFYDRDSEDAFLVEMVSRKIIDNTLEEIFDPKLEHESNDNVRIMIEAVVELAGECLQPEGASRPSMAQVVSILNEIKEMPGLNELHANSSDT